MVAERGGGGADDIPCMGCCGIEGRIGRGGGTGIEGRAGEFCRNDGIGPDAGAACVAGGITAGCGSAGVGTDAPTPPSRAAP
jgi:hypothetical protein